MRKNGWLMVASAKFTLKIQAMKWGCDGEAGSYLILLLEVLYLLIGVTLNQVV